MVKIKKRPFLQTAVARILKYIECNIPKLANLINYHARIVAPDKIQNAKTFFREAKWIQSPYLESLKTLSNSAEMLKLMDSDERMIKLSVLETEDFEIHGHIKAPIKKSTGYALSYLPIDRLSLTDAYPLPIYRTRHLSGHVIFIPAIENYFHLIVDYLLPAVSAIIRDPQSFKKVTLVTQREFPIAGVILSALEDLGISVSILRTSPFDRLIGGKLLIGGSTHRDSGCAFVYAEEARALANLLDKHIRNIETPRRIFVTRSNAQRRRIINEKELSVVLERHDIKVVELGFDNPLEQIALFRNAEFIMSVHGASLTNLIWTKNARVIELFPSNLRPKHYLNIAAQMDLEYQPIIGSEGDKREDFYIDIAEIEKVL
jgi:hypothetical protein